MQRGAVGFVEKGVSMKNVIAHLHEVARAPEARSWSRSRSRSTA